MEKFLDLTKSLIRPPLLFENKTEKGIFIKRDHLYCVCLYFRCWPRWYDRVGQGYDTWL